MPKWLVRAFTVALPRHCHAYLGYYYLEFESSFPTIPGRECE